MHKSGLVGFIIDCKSDDLDAAAQFWSEALRLPISEAGLTPNPNYRQLALGPSGLNIEVQKVDHPSWVHLDIESDDIPAEVQRLEGLGAGWSAMSKPGWSWKPQPATGSASSGCASHNPTRPLPLTGRIFELPLLPTLRRW